MCTAISFLTNDHYFGRNLDLEYHYQESVTVTPRNYPFRFHAMPTTEHHYALIGVAYVYNHTPLYYEATNEWGLSMAGLNFPGNAVYHPFVLNKDNIAPHELIPWVLGKCKTIADAKKTLKNINILNQAFRTDLPLSPLHWMLCDSRECLVLEPMEDGLRIHENPVGVLTNNPPFPYHLLNLCNYMNITSDKPDNRFSCQLELSPYSNGMGGVGLPGDLSSASRFVRAAFTLQNAKCARDEVSSVTQFFHILGSVVQQEGCVKVGDAYEKTVYSSCCNTSRGIYYYKTYSNSQITAIDMHKENLDGNSPVFYPLRFSQNIFTEN